MRTITKTLYKFNELSEDAQEKALMHYQASGEQYHWADEALQSLKEFADALNVRLANYEIDWLGGTCPSFATTDNDEHALDAEDAQQVIKNGQDAKWTGYCADCACADGFKEAWEAGEREASELFQAGFATWLKDTQADAEHQFSYEGYADFADANELEFYEDGTLA